MSKSLIFVFSLESTAGNLRATAKETRSCGVDATMTLTGQAPRLTGAVAFAAPHGVLCSSSPASGPPETKAKFEFTSDQEHATLYYPSPSGSTLMTDYALPKTLVVDVFYNAPFDVIMKKDGYFDCVLSMKFKKDPPTVIVNGVAKNLSLNALGSPNLAHCTMQPIK